MPVAYTFVTVLVVFAILLGAGNGATQAWRKALTNTLTDQDVAHLPLTAHAKESHLGQAITAPIVQELLLKGFCTPKRIYVGCKDQKVIFACKVNTASSIWAVVVIGMRGWKPAIMTAYAAAPTRLDTLAKASGCKMPALWMP